MKVAWFTNASIRIKLISIMTLTAILALFLATAAVVINEYFTKKNETEKQLSLTADIIARNCSASLTFNDITTAQEMLNSMNSQASVISAQLYNHTGALFASYQSTHSRVSNWSKESIQHLINLPQQQAQARTPIELLQEKFAVWTSHLFSTGNESSRLAPYRQSIFYDQKDVLHIFRPILLDGELQGILHLADDQSGLKAILKRFYLIISLIFVFTVISILFLSTKLQQVFLAPLLTLMQAMQSVIHEKNYTRSIAQIGTDEFGEMANVYNTMLIEIQQREKQLQNHRDQLEQQVAARTQELSEKNTSLNIAIQAAIEAKEQAEAANKSKSQFLANMSHEIRTPMNGVLGMAELLLGTELTEEQLRFAETVHNSGESLLAIINDILDFSKIEAGRFELENLDFNLHKTIEDVIELFAEKAASKNLELNYYISAEVPEGIKGDPMRIRQVLCNLVGNAIKFTGQGEIVVDISLEPHFKEIFPEATDNNAVGIRFVVRDTGIGISKAVLPKLFQAFSQADESTTRKYGGTGLGLVICKQLVELMRGNISVETHVGQGSAFAFTLPLSAATNWENDRVEVTSELSGLKLLIVEDNLTNRDVLQSYARAWGMVVDSVASGLAALELLRKPDAPSYDLAIIDMKMAGMNGMELGQRLKADPKLAKIPLVMLTSTQFKGEAADAKKIGFAAYLTKPIRKEMLYQCLFKVLQPESTPFATTKTDSAPLPPTKLDLRILLAEDNPVNQAVASAMLKRFGCTIDIANNGLETLQALEMHAYDLVLMDCMMPELDGYMTTAEIRLRQSLGQLPQFPIIALTANAIEGDREKCLIAGMDDYISKPFTAESLLRVIKSWLNTAPVNITEAPEVTSAEVSLDAIALDAIRTLDPNNGTELLQQVITLYLSNADTLLQALEQAWATGELEVIRATSHTLKSSSSQVGAHRLAELCREVENEAREYRYDASGNTLASILREFSSTQAALEAYVG